MSPFDKEGNLKPLPIGLQEFSEIMQQGVAYVDKTEHVYRMTRPGSKYVFLSRPRRFGKSLLCSTLEAYFEGRKELFEGLKIASLEKDWVQHEVIMLSMNKCKFPSAKEVEISLGNMLRSLEKRYEIDTDGTLTTGDRLGNIIETAFEKSGKPVVVIIDEYDAPLLEVLHDEAKLAEVRALMKSFYEVLKPSDKYLRFVFMTGITKFAQLSLFSAFNNINNISMDSEFADLCGITTMEIESQLRPYVESLADAIGKDYDGAMHDLKKLYDGYHFVWPSADIYNPFSLILALAKRQLRSFWFGSGTPTFLIEMMQKFGTDPTALTCVKAREADFDHSTDTLQDIVPLMYQSGYLTLKDYDEEFDEYTLGLPNKEVRDGLMDSLARHYAGPALMPMRDCVREMRIALNNDDLETALCLIRDFLKTVPYANVTNREGHYQQMLYIIFSLVGAYADAELRTARGRLDIVLATKHRIYLIELKLNKSASEAMRQIDLRDYPSRFASYKVPICKVGINFSAEERTITDWVIEE